VERSAETTRDDPDGEYLKRNRWFESGSLQWRVRVSRDFAPSRRKAGLFPPVCGAERAARSGETGVAR